ncbi:hypothetical protein [Hymenobacter yonginensis]|uniref:STAS/SEC14 domain-containing protein n=1 Tax=Hymenobacter yonginensis TaxID=748197 RepID=A0ABY7PPB3_9BACT|nr:hypothetical protein [Hymenobacter yonginensis]WBO84584.1 hypothetical protein O9Z63_19735 [Hymenobacter yonginensis]
MPTPTLLADFAELSFRPDLQILLGRWLRPISTAELQQSYEALLTAAVPPKCRFWLLDLRRRGISSEDDTLWTLETFLPLLAPRLGGRVYLAFLVSPGHLSAIDQESGAPMVTNAQCHVRLFTDEGLATAWLGRRRQHESV